MAEPTKEKDPQEKEREEGLTSQIGPLEINWPLTVGYYGGIGVALAFDMVAPPLALFVAAVPFFKMLNRPDASQPTRLISQLLQGMATPVNGDAPASIRLTTPNVAQAAKRITSDTPAERRPSIWAEARQLADRARIGNRNAAADQP